MKKTFLLLVLLNLLTGCQREKVNEVGVGYNKSLIIPPTNDLPTPGSNQEVIESIQSSNSLVDSILAQTEADQANSSIIDQIDQESGYKTDENFFQWLFKGKSKR
ncbi:lipoprotein [Alphaproteobacteria bacterium]|nr:lipoprotein [Alphaproteobacteria bacterium]